MTKTLLGITMNYIKKHLLLYYLLSLTFNYFYLFKIYFCFFFIWHPFKTVFYRNPPTGNMVLARKEKVSPLHDNWERMIAY